jgi:hypothetical protein
MKFKRSHDRKLLTHQLLFKKAKLRLANKTSSVKFISSDITKFNPTEKYKLWHDRATFHFLTEESQVEKYLQIASEAIDDSGFLIVTTFSKNGPEKCINSIQR